MAKDILFTILGLFVLVFWVCFIYYCPKLLAATLLIIVVVIISSIIGQVIRELLKK